MEIIISNNANKPIYEQITFQIKAMIMSEELKAGDNLPSMRALAKSLHVSVITVQKAYEDLQRDGFIETTIGRGTTSPPTRAPSPRYSLTPPRSAAPCPRLSPCRWNANRSRPRRTKPSSCPRRSTTSGRVATSMISAIRGTVPRTSSPGICAWAGCGIRSACRAARTARSARSIA